MFLIQQLALVGVQLVQLKIAAATEIHVCTPKNWIWSWNVPHGLSPTADYSHLGHWVLPSWPALRGKEWARLGFHLPQVKRRMVWTQQYWFLTCLCSPQAGTLLQKKMANAENCCIPGPMSTKQALFYVFQHTDSSYECPYNSCTEDFSY